MVNRSNCKVEVDGLIIQITSIHINDLEEDYMRITYEDKDATRQFVLDHSILKKLSNINKNLCRRNTNLLADYPKSFSKYAYIRDNILILPALNIGIPSRSFNSE